MSELKDYSILDIEAMDDERLEKSESGKIQATRVYIKSDADAAIDELKAAHHKERHEYINMIAELKADYKEACDRLQTANLIKDEQIAATRHQKYKRCLAKAEMCGNAYDKWMMKKANAIGLGKDGVAYYLEARRKVSHYMRWHKRWRKIAGQFKEAK